MWSDRSSATRPSPSRDKSSNGLFSGPCITVVPLAARLSTRRNQRLQCGGGFLGASGPRDTRWGLAGLGGRGRNAPPGGRPLGAGGRGPRGGGAPIVGGGAQ